MKHKINSFFSKKKIEKKISKLKRNPQLFLSDMLVKHKIKVDEYLPKRKYYTENSYTVVTAVYNTGIYLDKFFESITQQTMIFEKNIVVICVDDGSTDDSKDIIEKWISKYPKNIKYIYKKNSGQASARNIGLDHVESDWVTFIDSDDFINSKYFENVDREIKKNNEIQLVCCNQIYFFEEKNECIDRHPLNYRFKKDAKKLFYASDLGKNLQFSAPLSFFSVKNINEELKFDEQLKPTFEDGKFLNTYLLGLEHTSQVYFCDASLYFNRKRKDQSSTMDNAWNNKGQFSTVLEIGYLKLLESYELKLGLIPKFIQRTILWELLRIIKHTVDNESNVSFLSRNEKEYCLELMRRCFKYIDSDVILNFELGNCGFSRQVGMLGCFKGENPPQQVVYIEKIENQLGLIQLRYFTFHETKEEFLFNNKSIEPISFKVIDRMIMGEKFLSERRIWLPINESGIFEVKLDNKPIRIHYLGKKYNKKISLSLEESVLKNNIWLFMDRDDSAGDNAEALYSYVKNIQKIKSYFILKEGSQDWFRLKKKGFNIIDHGSNQHKDLLQQADCVISSHVGNIIDPFGISNRKYKIFFLQHGVTKDNVSKWLNNSQFDFIFTATNQEYKSIANPNSKYIKSEFEVFLTGFPRFDKLINNDIQQKNEILFMPTWRKNLTGLFLDNKSSIREYNKDFNKSEYFNSIEQFVNSSYLLDLCEKYNLKIVFCPHPNIEPYLKEFNFNSEIVRVKDSFESFSDLIVSSKALITDYSSVAFDFAYLNKPVLYYQFDEIDFFNGSHTYSKGYYDYRLDGFGPVLNTEGDLIESVKDLICNNFENPSVYADVVRKTFAYHDNKNCERTYQVISDYFEGELLYNIDLSLRDVQDLIVKPLMSYYYQKNNFSKVIYMLEKFNMDFQVDNIINAYMKLGDFDKAYKVLKSTEGDYCVGFNSLKIYSDLCMIVGDYSGAKCYLDNIIMNYGYLIDTDIRHTYYMCGLMLKISN